MNQKTTSVAPPTNGSRLLSSSLGMMECSMPSIAKYAAAAVPVARGYNDPKIGPEKTATMNAPAIMSHTLIAVGSPDRSETGNASSPPPMFMAGCPGCSGKPGVSGECCGAWGAADC